MGVELNRRQEGMAAKNTDSEQVRPDRCCDRERDGPSTTTDVKVLFQIQHRAERRVVALAKNEAVPALACPYLNRLSDLLFVASRVLNRHAGGGDVLWQPGKNRK